MNNFLIFLALCTLSLSATDLTSQSYLYDNEGEPRFIKIYIDPPTPKRRTSSLQAGLQQILNRMAQEDATGRYIVIPLKKKKGKNTSDAADQSVWECPYCGKSNPVFENRCAKKSCSLH